MGDKLTADEQRTINGAIAQHTTGERTKWCNELLGYLGQFKWAGNTADWSNDNTKDLAMNCWCAPIYVAYKNKRLTKKSVDNFSLMPFQYPKLSVLHQSQHAAFDFLKGEAATEGAGIPGDLIFFFVDSIAIGGTSIPQSQQDYNASVPLASCPVHVAVNMGQGMCLSLWSTPNNCDRYQYCSIAKLVEAIENDRKAKCNYTSIEPFWIAGAKSKKRCYITTAVCQSRGLPDDCRELETLRWFRDAVVSGTPEGRSDILEYYRTAPGIVDEIEKHRDASEIYSWLYRSAITPAVDAVERGDYQMSHLLIREMVADLNRRFSDRNPEPQADVRE